MSKVIIAISGNLDSQLVAELLAEERVGYELLRDSEQYEKLFRAASLIIVDSSNARRFTTIIAEVKKQSKVYIPVLILLPAYEKAEKWLIEYFDDIIRIPTSRKELKTRIHLHLQLHRQSVQILENSEQKYRTIFEATGTATLLVAEDTTILMANANVFPLTGYTPEELIGTSWTKYASPRYLDQMLHYHRTRRINPDEAPNNYEVAVLHKNGEERTVILTATMMPRSSESIISLMDITELKRAQALARESDERLRLAFNTTPDAIAISRLSDGLYVDVNASFESLSGYSRDEIINHTSTELNIWENTSERNLFLQKVRENGFVTNYELNLRKKDGQIFPVLVSSALVNLNGQEHLISITRDISEFKKAQEQVRLLSSAIEQNPIAALITDVEGKIVFVNKCFTDLTGYTISDLKNDVHVLFRPNNFSNSLMQQLLEKVGQKEKWSEELMIERKDGTQFWASVSLSAIFDLQDVVSHYLITIEDITEKKKILQDLVLAKEKAEESDRLKTAFLHNISHEIRTPMNAIMGFSEFLVDPELPEQKRKQFVEIILRSGNQLLSIINDIISIAIIEAGQEKLYETDTNLAEIIRLVYNQYLSQAANQHIELRCEPLLCENDYYIKTDKTKLTQILSNLVGNAIKFTHKGYVELGYHVEKEYILFYVRDTGIGIPKKAQGDIFKRFRQARRSDGKIYGGSGLGLAISKAYLDLMGGRIWVESEEGKGSNFYFTIPNRPLIISQKDDDVSNIEPTLSFKSKKRILVAEDEESNFALIEEYLSDLNIEIVRAEDGEEAIEICELQQPIDLILMDIKMPRKDGLEATMAIKKKYPTIPIIAQTAYALEEDRTKILQAGCDDYVSKPLSKDRLIQVIRFYLD
ncbi:MAG: PAS domain S-box protein [Bacteroidales bacterium]